MQDGGLAEALEAGILEIDGDRIAFTHPLLRSAVSARSTPAQRRSLHARLARLVPEREERARHLALATPLPSGEVAAVVEEAAESVRARGATAAAAELAELAVRLTPPEDVDDLRRRVLDCADRHREAGDGRRAIALLEQAREEAPAGPTRRRSSCAWPGRWRRSTARARRSTSIARRSPRPRATRRSRPRSTSTSPAPWQRRTTG